MEVEVLYVPGCPHRALVTARLQLAIERLAVEAAVRETEVSTREAARVLGMRGSPTVLVNGRDPFAGLDAEPSLSCRLYRSEGRIEGAPAVEDLVVALAAAAGADHKA